MRLAVGPGETGVAQGHGTGIEGEVLPAQICLAQAQVGLQVGAQRDAGGMHARATCGHLQPAFGNAAAGCELDIAAEGAAAALETQLPTGQEAVVGTQVRHAGVAEDEVGAGALLEAGHAAFAGTGLQVQAQAFAFDEGLARFVGDDEALHVQRQGGHQRAGLAFDTEVGTGLAFDVVTHHFDAGAGLGHADATARRELTSAHLDVGIDQALAVQLEPLRLREHRRNPRQGGEAPLHQHVAVGARHQGGEVVQRHLPPLHAQVGVELEVGAGLFGHLRVDDDVLVHRDIETRLPLQRLAIQPRAHQRRMPLQAAALHQFAAAPVQVELGAAFAGRGAYHRMAADIALQRQGGGAALQAQVGVGLEQFVDARGLVAAMRIERELGIQLRVAQQDLPALPQRGAGEVALRRRQRHRTAAQLFAEADLRVALAFQAQVAEVPALHAVADDALEAQGPAGLGLGVEGRRQDRRTGVATRAALHVRGHHQRHAHFAPQQRQQGDMALRVGRVHFPTGVHDVALQLHVPDPHIAGPPADRRAPLDSELLRLAVGRPRPPPAC